jgi:positive regulator of sigma E activity
MSLATLHQVLIASAAALAALFALRSLSFFSRGAGAHALALAIGAISVTVAALVYLRRFRRKLAGRESRL